MAQPESATVYRGYILEIPKKLLKNHQTMQFLQIWWN